MQRSQKTAIGAVLRKKEGCCWNRSW